jgi:hypothetical protein
MTIVRGVAAVGGRIATVAAGIMTTRRRHPPVSSITTTIVRCHSMKNITGIINTMTMWKMMHRCYHFKE